MWNLEGAMNIVLVEPQIPPNTGNVARLCAATGSVLHIVRPIPFRMDDRSLRRAGCDYWDYVDVVYHNSLDEFLLSVDIGKCYFFSKKAVQLYTSVMYKMGDYLVFGSETEGLAPAVLKRYSNRCLKIPMPGCTRSLNLSTSVGVVLYEALRQIHNW